MNEQEIKAVDDHISSAANLKKVNTAHFASMSEAQKLSVIGLVAVICNAYAAAKPVLDFVLKYLLFWKPKWKTVIENVETGIQDACAALNP